MRSAGWRWVVMFVWTQCLRPADFEKTIYKDPMSSVIFYCRPSQTSLQLLWKLEQPQKPETLLFTKDRHLTSDKYYSIDSKYQSWNLVLSTVLKRHEGIYSCQELPAGGDDFVTLQKVTLSLNGPPELSLPNTPWLKTVPVIEGETTRLTCDVTGSPAPSISWSMMNDGQIKSIHIEGPILQIHNITRACGAQYVCFAKNRFSETPLNMTFDVDVQFPAQILLYDANSPRKEVTSTILNRKLGMEVVLRCDVMMYPKVNIYWKIRNLKNSKLREIASYIPGVGISDYIKMKGVYQFKLQEIQSKKVTMFDIVFRTDQEMTFSEYVCETERSQFPGVQKRIKIQKLP